jgi:tricorn protease-like protein
LDACSARLPSRADFSSRWQTLPLSRHQPRSLGKRHHLLRIALTIDNGLRDVWLIDLARGTRTRLTFGPVFNNAPTWSPDGKWIVYNSGRNGKSELFRTSSDGSGAEEELLSDDQIIMPSD